MRARPIVVSAFKGDKGDPGDVSAQQLSGAILTAITAHTQGSAAHADIRAAITSRIEAHNQNNNAHQDIRGVHIAHEQKC